MKQVFEKQSKERAMFVDFWSMCQEYWIPEDSGEYWDKLIRATDLFMEKYPCRFASELAVALISKCELEQREQKRGAWKVE